MASRSDRGGLLDALERAGYRLTEPRRAVAELDRRA